MNDRTSDDYDLNQLLHPAQAFGHPTQVVNDPDLTLNEKRAILASWASDACAVEAPSDLRTNARGAPVRFDDIWKRCGRLIDKPTAIVIGAYSITGAACSAASPGSAQMTAAQLLSRKKRVFPC
jgi:hypothetical protein